MYVKDPQGEAIASCDSSEWIWGARRLNGVDMGVKAMVSGVDPGQWRATRGSECVGLGISGIQDVRSTRPAEAYDGLFYVPPRANEEGDGFRTYLCNRDGVHR